MPIRKYYCDYCEKQFQDTPSDRKRHCAGVLHQQAKARWYDSFKFQHHHPATATATGAPKSLCFHFVNTGFCRYGDSCKYFHPTANNTQQQQQQQPIISSPGNVVGGGDTSSMKMGVSMSWDNLPPSLQPPPEGGYPHLPFLDWG